MSAHYLGVDKSAVGPSRQLVVAYSTRDRTIRLDTRPRKVRTLTAWRLALLSGPEAGSAAIVHEAGTSPENLWTSVAEHLRGGGCTWLWTHGLHQLLCCSDWFDLLQLGKWRLSACNSVAFAPGGEKLERHWRGYLVDHDPPTLVLCRSATTGGTLLMTDRLNIDGRASVPSGLPDDQLTELVDWVRAWGLLVTEQHWGPLRPTAAAQSMTAFRNRYMDIPILCHDQPEVQALERDAYFPGRNEAWQLGHVSGPIYELDIQSCYPALAATLEVPVKLEAYVVGEDVDVLRLHDAGYALIAEVEIETGRNDYPYRHGREVWFPVGRFVTTLAGPELVNAAEDGALRLVRRCAVYRRAPALRAFATSMLGLRAAAVSRGDRGRERGIKAVTNCLWGAFAKRSRRWAQCTCSVGAPTFSTWYGRPPPVGHVCKDATTPRLGDYGSDRLLWPPSVPWRNIGGHTEYEGLEREQADGAIAISAYVASAARAQLAGFIDAAGSEGTFYCDTDSIWASASGMERLIFNGHIGREKPGHLRLVARHSWMHVHGLKQYETGLIRCSAGTPVSAERIATGAYEWEAVEGISGPLRRSETPCGIVVPRCRSIRLRYDAGVVGTDGRITPHIVAPRDTIR
jgi:hypothetical protein